MDVVTVMEMMVALTPEVRMTTIMDMSVALTPTNPQKVAGLRLPGRIIIFLICLAKLRQYLSLNEVHWAMM